LVLASDEDGGSLDALKFSLASDIVELVVLTADDAFLQTLREAVGGARRLWHVPSGDKVSDLLVAGEVGIVVLDVHALHEQASVFIGQIKRQFPDLVIVVAGNRDDETSLAGLISAGIVYRFIHKPMSPARAKLFAEAAIRKHDAQRRRAIDSPRSVGEPRLMRPWLIAAGIAMLGVIAAVTWLLHGNTVRDGTLPPAVPSKTAASAPPLLALAAAALAANRLTEPPGDNALELYLQAQASNPADAQVRAGLGEVHERLLARAENALLEERLDEAAAAIETARKAGVESGRIAFLTAQLAKSRDQAKGAQAKAASKAQTQAQGASQSALQTAAPGEAKSDAERTAGLLNLAAQRIDAGQLLEPERDNARFYVQEALRAAPDSAAVQETRSALASRLLADAHSAIDGRDFARAASLIEGADGIVAAANIEAAQVLLANARNQADGDARAQLLKNANDRLLQDRLIEPANDNAKYYFLTLRRLDPGNPALGALMQDLGNRIAAKARRAIILDQLDAARSWLDAAAEIGFSSAETTSAQRDWDSATAQQKFLTTLVPASQLKLLKSVNPVYPKKAQADKTEGWVELDFTIAETGHVKDVVVHAASTPGLFDEAAVKAVSQWRYQPVLRDAKPVAVRTEIRVRFTLS
jgi:TonB family protein